VEYDVIVVGARCAGSSLAMLLARDGARVLLVDRARFPSDTFNGHYIHAAGVRSLERWGLLDRVMAPGSARPVRSVRMDFAGTLQFAGRPGWPDGQPAFGLAPRRHRLDALLVEAAAEAGAEVRQAFCVDDLVWDGERVVGIRGRDADGQQVVEERAEIVVGADGLRSMVAARVEAGAYETIPALTCAYYSHWADIPTDELSVWLRPGQWVITFPTDAGLTCVAVGWRHSEFARVRSNVEAEFLAALEIAPEVSERVRNGRRVEPLRGSPDLPMYLRVPSGSGWALVGDAGCRVDPITGEGITDAFRDAGLLAEAIGQGLGGARPLDEALGDYQRRRDLAVLPVYRYTADRARLQPLSPDQTALLSAIAQDQTAADLFVGLTAGTTSFADFFAPEHIGALVGRPADRAA
jgi:flavin-dependent dehydrogenase